MSNTALMTPKEILDLAEELVARVGEHTEYAIYDWLDQVRPSSKDRRRLLLSVASMVDPDPGYAEYVRERFNPPKAVPK